MNNQDIDKKIDNLIQSYNIIYGDSYIPTIEEYILIRNQSINELENKNIQKSKSTDISLSNKNAFSNNQLSEIIDNDAKKINKPSVKENNNSNFFSQKTDNHSNNFIENAKSLQKEDFDVNTDVLDPSDTKSEVLSDFEILKKVKDDWN